MSQNILALLHVFVLIHSVGLSAGIAALPYYLTECLGMSDTERGLVMSMYAVGAVSALILWLTRRDLVHKYLSFPTVTLVTSIVFFLIPALHDLSLLCLLQLVRGLTGCCMWAYVENYLLVLTEPGRHRRTHVALYGIMFSIGFALGMSLGVKLYEINMLSPFLAAGTVTTSTAVLSHYVCKHIRSLPSSIVSEIVTENMRRPIRTTLLLSTALTTSFVYGFYDGAATAHLLIYFVEVTRLTHEQVSLYLLVVLLAAPLLTMILMHKLKHERAVVLTLSIMICASPLLVHLLLQPSTPYVILMIVGTLVAMMYTVVYVLGLDVLSYTFTGNTAEDVARNVKFASVYNIGFLAGTVGVGILIDTLSWCVLYYSLAVPLVFALLTLLCSYLALHKAKSL